MICHNDDLVEPGAGYPDHPHSDLEIVTWVLSGALVHTSSDGARTVVNPGDVQVMSAGSGIVHSELVDPVSGPTRFIQVWLRPSVSGAVPGHRLEAVRPGNELVEAVGGAGLPIGTEGARLLVGRLTAGTPVVLPDDPLAHVFVATGSVDTPEGLLVAGDALRVADAPGMGLAAATDTELLVWSFAEPPP